MANSAEIKSGLEEVLKKDNIKDVCVNILGNTNPGDGSMGDLVFVSATGKDENSSTKEYNLGLKFSKRGGSSVKEAFLNEIFFYEKLLPIFTQFQKDKNIDNPFDSVPRYYGSFSTDGMEVIVLENLQKSGYELWPKKHAVTRNHIDIVIKEYGRFHATSAAFSHQQPTKFQELVDSLGDAFKKFVDQGILSRLIKASIDEASELLKDELDNNVMLKWKSLKERTDFVLKDMTADTSGLKVILHGDCWNNNFMYLPENENRKVLKKVAILDWQMARYNSPILDLSYFLFASISGQDLENFDNVLALYYESFTTQLRHLGISDSLEFYPFNQFISEWKNYSKHGVLMVSLMLKICSTEINEFQSQVRDKNNFKNRIRPIIEYAVKHDLI